MDMAGYLQVGLRTWSLCAWVLTVCCWTGKAETMKLSVSGLIFGAPRLLEWLGWSITKRPHLLGTLLFRLTSHTMLTVSQ